MSNKETLLPCPFCGGEPHYEDYGDDELQPDAYCLTDGCQIEGIVMSVAAYCYLFPIACLLLRCFLDDFERNERRAYIEELRKHSKKWGPIL